ncbi:MAG: hypothetical protein EXR74_08735 [Bdellovibrionales bacterium]|nr:hypothetical protein [Bdellovibrionales bacterium]
MIEIRPPKILIKYLMGVAVFSLRNQTIKLFFLLALALGSFLPTEAVAACGGSHGSSQCASRQCGRSRCSRPSRRCGRRSRCVSVTRTRCRRSC